MTIRNKSVLVSAGILFLVLTSCVIDTGKGNPRKHDSDIMSAMTRARFCLDAYYVDHMQYPETLSQLQCAVQQKDVDMTLEIVKHESSGQAIAYKLIGTHKEADSLFAMTSGVPGVVRLPKPIVTVAGEPKQQEAKQESLVERMNKDALFLFEKGLIMDAIQVWQSAVNRIKETNSDIAYEGEVLNNIGYAYYKLGKANYALSEQYLQMARQADPKRWSVYLNLADLFYAMNRVDAAAVNYEKLLLINPEYKHAAMIRQRLAELKEKMPESGE